MAGKNLVCENQSVLLPWWYIEFHSTDGNIVLNRKSTFFFAWSKVSLFT